MTSILEYMCQITIQNNMDNHGFFTFVQVLFPFACSSINLLFEVDYSILMITYIYFVWFTLHYLRSTTLKT